MLFDNVSEPWLLTYPYGRSPLCVKLPPLIRQLLQHASLLKIEVFRSRIRLADCYQDAPRLAKENIRPRRSGSGVMIYLKTLEDITLVAEGKIGRGFKNDILFGSCIPVVN